MRITVIGAGYVGLAVGAGLAHAGNDIICADIDEAKVARLNGGEIPIHEPGLEPLVKENLARGRLRFTADVAAAAAAAEILFIAVGTPPGNDGSADLRHVLEAAATIGRAMNGEKIVVTKSTVPVGTAARIRETIEARSRHPVHVCSNPEFLREGAAVGDFMKPDRVVIGADDPKVAAVVAELYRPFVRSERDILVMDVASAELTKYAANAMLATRVSLMNSMARLCEAVGADVDLVRRGVGSDARIGASFLFPGVGYGGPCLPKDLSALIRTSRRLGVEPAILEAVEKTNEEQRRLILDRVVQRFGPDLSGRRFALWGLAFKPDTDDLRDAPSRVTIAGLLERGAQVVAHDPAAMPQAPGVLDERVELRATSYDTLPGASALLIHTEWHAYRNPDFQRIGAALAEKVIIDGRNLYSPDRMRRLGFDYYSVGRRPAGGGIVAATNDASTKRPPRSLPRSALRAGGAAPAAVARPGQRGPK